MSRFRLREGWRSPNCCINGKFRYSLRSNPGAGSGNDRLKTIVGAWRKAYRTARRSDHRGGRHEPIPTPGRAAFPQLLHKWEVPLFPPIKPGSGLRERLSFPRRRESRDF